MLDSAAEDHEVEDLNTARWALVPRGMDPEFTGTPASVASLLGFDLHYRERRTPYVVGLKLIRHLKENWQLYGDAGDYEVYRHR